MKNFLKYILICLIVFGGLVGYKYSRVIQTPPVQASSVVTTVQDRPLLELINELRAEKGVAPLTASPELDKSAQEKAADMATQHYFAHANPQGIHGIAIIPHYLPQATRGSENLAYCGKNDNNLGAFELWSNSPAHYQGMIDPTVTLYGEGKAWDSEKHCTVYVNHFAAV
jgi:uncharacterized protein YkwD